MSSMPASVDNIHRGIASSDEPISEAISKSSAHDLSHHSDEQSDKHSDAPSPLSSAGSSFQLKLADKHISIPFEVLQDLTKVFFKIK